MNFPHGFTATVIRPGGHDRHGNPLQATEHTIQRCARDQQRTVAIVDGTTIVTTVERLLCDDPTADAQAGDLIRMPDNTLWRVNGDVDRPDSPFTGWKPGCTIPLERSADARTPQE